MTTPILLPKNRRVFTSKSTLEKDNIPSMLEHKVEGVIFSFSFQMLLETEKRCQAIFRNLIGDWLTVNLH